MIPMVMVPDEGLVVMKEIGFPPLQSHRGGKLPFVRVLNVLMNVLIGKRAVHPEASRTQVSLVAL